MKRCKRKILAYFQDLKRREKQGEVFAKGISTEKLFFIFLIASIFGTYYEQILNLVKFYLRDGIIFWEMRRGVFYGPFSPIYGVGAVLMIVFLARKNHTYLQTFCYGALLGGIYEYTISLLQEIFTHTVSWDYSKQLLNIGGRTTIPFMLVWGLFVMVFIHFIYPLLSKAIEKIPLMIGTVLFYLLIFFLILDCLISWTALIRGMFRRNDYPPFTPVGAFYDRVYPDPVLEHYFPNMQFGVEERGK